MADVEPLRQQIRLRATTAWARMAEPLEARLRQTAPSKSGELARATTVRPAGPLRLTVRVGVPYASYVREGTRPHEIRPRTRRMLAFDWPAAPATLGRLPDGRVLARRVRHPGTDPQGWYDEALTERTALFRSELDRSTL